MAVIINELDVSVAPQAPPAAPAQVTGPQPPASPTSPREVMAAVEHMRARAERLRAS
jgi:hypothetical protein